VPRVAARSYLRVVALADSLALPRSEGGERVAWEETWPSELQRLLGEVRPGAQVVNCGRRARTVDSLLAEDFFEHVVLTEPSDVVVQVGIVDCAPRVLSRRDQRVLNSRLVPERLRRWVIERRRRARRALVARDPLRKVYTPPREFAEQFSEFLKRTAELETSPRLIVVPILGRREVLDAKSPGFSKNIDTYNEALQACCQRSEAVWLGVDSIEGGIPVETAFCYDGYHLTKEGNGNLARILAQTLLDPCR